MPSLSELYHPPDGPIPTHRSSYPFISPSKYRGALEGKVALITGAGRGIGREAALAFMAAGASVACVSQTESDLEDLLQQIEKRTLSDSNAPTGTGNASANPDDTSPARDARHEGAIAIPGDVADPSFAPKAVAQTEERLGPISILINNAGLSRISSLEHETSVLEPWRVIEVSLLGSMSFTQAVIPSMISQLSGTIINVVSILGKVTVPWFSAYAAAKAGLAKYTEVTDLELREKGISSFAVHPCMSLETTIARGAVNKLAMEEVKGMKAWMGEFVSSNADHVDMPVDTFVALCCEERARVLSGRFVDATYDVGKIIWAAEQELEDERAGGA